MTGETDEPEASPLASFERVVLVTIDTLRADHLEPYGYLQTTSPFLDGLARDGVFFSRAMAVSSHTAPSHASMFTGLAPSEHGVLRNSEVLDEALPNMARFFLDRGYSTAGFVSAMFLQGLEAGFQGIQMTSRADLTTLAAMSWVRARQKTSPNFFLWVHYYDVHQWYDDDLLPKRHLKRIEEACPLEQQEFYAYIADLHGLPAATAEEFEPLDWGIKDGEPFRIESAEAVTDWMHRYDARIAFVDDAIKRLYDFIERLDLDGETLWIVTSDHGEGLGSHGHYNHGIHIYNEQLWVPLILHGTGGSLPAVRVDELVHHLDLFPTVVDLYGAEIELGKDPLSGRSLVPLIRGKSLGPTTRTAFAERRPPDEFRLNAGWVDERVYTVQSARFKYVHHSVAEDEFFDLEADPRERNNLAAVPSDERDALRRLMELKLELLSKAGTKAAASMELTPELLEELKRFGYAGD